MKRKIKKRIAQILTMFLMITVTIGFVPQMAAPVYSANGDPAMVYGSESVLKETVNTDNAQKVWYAGNAWYVINYDGKGNINTFHGGLSYIDPKTGKQVKMHLMTLFASGILKSEQMFKMFKVDDIDNDYKDSYLKETVDGLFDSQFSDKEQLAVAERELTVQEYVEGDFSNGVSGTATAGYLWPLSSLEVSYTPRTLLVSGSDSKDRWWLRSPGSYATTVGIVLAGGIILDGDEGYVIFKNGVRPAFYQNLQLILFTSAAEGGKTSGATGADALQEVSTNKTNDWKLTLKDDGTLVDSNKMPIPELSEHRKFIASVASVTDNGVTVSYSKAKTGANEYISAIITDGPITEDGANIKYYGRVRNCVRGAGTVEINTAGKLDNGDKLYVFNEQYNGDKKTDYASALKDVTPHPMVGRVSIRDAKVVLNKTDFTFNTKVQRPAIETIGGLALKEETDYTAEWSNASSKDVGTYTVTITGKGKYSDTTTATYKISKAYNPLKIKGKTATVKYSKLKKKNQTLAVSKVMSFTNDVKDKKTYSLTSAKKGKKSFKKYFKVNKTSGKLTVKKGLKKGTYKVKIKVNAAGNKNYKAVTKAVTVTVRVR